MSAIMKNIDDQSIHNETQQIHDGIKSHPAWRGAISGLKAEKMLRGRDPYFYILRTGQFQNEHQVEYYATFVHADGSVRHQPFVITTTTEGWNYENHGHLGPFNYMYSIDDAIHFIMHCARKDAKAFSLFVEKE
ncbi:MAG: hypothetical protein Q8L98_08085 [Chlamydiales bacterium]|nr:hypothetical protein [Chlamydiales bacterium]